MKATDNSIKSVEEIKQYKVLYAIRNNEVLKLENIEIEASTGSWVILKSDGKKRHVLTFFNIDNSVNHEDQIFANYWWAYAYLLALRGRNAE
jgi:hypothetical protein